MIHGGRLRVGLCQVKPRKGDVDANVALVRSMLRPGADILAFPETALTGYFVEGRQANWHSRPARSCAALDPRRTTADPMWCWAFMRRTSGRVQQPGVPHPRTRPLRSHTHPPQGVSPDLRTLRGKSLRRTRTGGGGLRYPFWPDRPPDLRGSYPLADSVDSGAGRRQPDSVRLRVARRDSDPRCRVRRTWSRGTGSPRAPRRSTASSCFSRSWPAPRAEGSSPEARRPGIRTGA